MVNKRNYFFLIFLFVFAQAALFAVPEVDQINPNEPEADLGIYGMVDAKTVTADVSVWTVSKPYIAMNLRDQFIPFMGGQGSFNQKDTAGGWILAGTQFVTMGFCVTSCVFGCKCIASVFGTISTMTMNDAEAKKNLQEKYAAEFYDTREKCLVYSGVTVGCLAAETIFCLVRPLLFVERQRKQTAFVLPVVTPDSCGAVAVLRL